MAHGHCLYAALSSPGLIYDREEDKALAFTFVIGSFAGLIGGVIAAIRTAWRAN